MKHITFDTCHCSDALPINGARKTLNLLKPMISSNGGIIPTRPGWKSGIDKRHGWAAFDVSSIPANAASTVNVVAWTDRGAIEAWEFMIAIREAMFKEMANYGFMISRPPIPEIPKSLPWLATWITPVAHMISHPMDLFWMASFEQSLAFAIMDSMNRPTQAG